ncbi:ABC transporter ATP-binding protein [Alcaligenaceae bacterium CGII-47]|nr:ABC transporter ATP-binding protein [Alcaligenaceae bacterium CGII-47]
MRMLDVESLTVKYGSLVAVREVSFSMNEGEVIALIGSNGAGKSTTLNALMGLVRASSGKIKIRGAEVHHELAENRVLRGVALSPEGRHLFGRMTVLDNLLVGAYAVKSRADIRQSLDEVYELFPRVYERRAQLAGSLSGGEQQMVAISRALMARPWLLMLDEPSLGIAPKVVAEIVLAIERLNRERGISIILVEQNARLALRLAHHAYALEHGEIVVSGKGSDLLDDPFVRKAYLGI